MISNVRYLFAVVLSVSIAWLTGISVVNDIIATGQTTFPQARELSRAELVIRANQASYVAVPSHDENTVAALNEPQLVAADLAREIDSAERIDAPQFPDNAIVVQLDVKQPKAASTRKKQRIVAPSALNERSVASAAGRKKRKSIVAPAPAQIAIELPPLAAQPDATTKQPIIPGNATLKAALTSTKPATSEPTRRKLARRSPNAGELIRMQLQNMI